MNREIERDWNDNVSICPISVYQISVGEGQRARKRQIDRERLE